MKLLQKVTFGLMASILFIGMMGSTVSAQALKSEKKGNGLTEEQMELSEIVVKHLDNFTDSNGNKQVKIINKEELKNELNNIDILSYEQLQSSVSQFNYYMDNGENTITKTADDVSNQLKANQTNGEISTMGFSCGDALTAIGLIHAGSYTAAAYLLGITGPAAIVVPLLVSAVYGIASIACD